MKPELRRVGEAQNPVVVVDDFTGAVDEVVELAAAMAPFPASSGSYYPGLRQPIAVGDAAYNYVERLLRAAGPFIGGGFDVDTFELLEASFSMVTTAPGALDPAQRAPHFDSTDPGYLALLHYLRVPDGSGTAFYRQRSTGIERVTALNASSYVPVAQLQAAQLPAGSGYITGSDSFYEQIGAVEAVPDRLVIYQGSLLHSGIIPDGMTFSADPRKGRLTANIIVRGH